MHAQVALVSTLRVLGRFATGEGLDADARSLIEEHLRKLAPGDVDAFIASRQQQDALPVTKLRQLHTPIAWLSIGLTLLALARIGVRQKELGTPALRFVLFVLAAYVINAALSANLSGIYDRYQSRLVWLFGLWLSVGLRLPFARGARAATQPSEAPALQTSAR